MTESIEDIIWRLQHGRPRKKNISSTLNKFVLRKMMGGDGFDVVDRVRSGVKSLPKNAFYKAIVEPIQKYHERRKREKEARKQAIIASTIGEITSKMRRKVSGGKKIPTTLLDGVSRLAAEHYMVEDKHTTARDKLYEKMIRDYINNPREYYYNDDDDE